MPEPLELDNPRLYADKIGEALADVDDADRSMFYVQSFRIAESGEVVLTATWDGGAYLLTEPDPGQVPEPRKLTDEQALDRIRQMLCEPEWGVGMLEDIAQLVRKSGRTIVDEPGSWGRH